MQIEAKQVDDLAEEFTKFEKLNFGAKGGDDFLVLARAFLASETGNVRLKAAVALGLLTTLLARPSDSKETTEQRLKRLMEDDNPFREFVVDVFYLGYRYGKMASEVDKLEQL
jgi:hypothetical protein